MFVRLFGQTTYRKFQMSAFKYFTMIACHVNADVYFSSLSRENERGGLLPDCRKGLGTKLVHGRCNHSSPAGQMNILCMSVWTFLLLAQARPRMMQHLSSMYISCLNCSESLAILFCLSIWACLSRMQSILDMSQLASLLKDFFVLMQWRI